MADYTAQVIWFWMHTLMQASIMKQNQEADLSIWKLTHSLLKWANFNYCTNDEIYTVLGCKSRNGCFILNSKINVTSEIHINWNSMASASLTNSSWKLNSCRNDKFYTCSPSLNLGTCASIVLITGMITAQNITQLYTSRQKGLLDLRDVYIIQSYLK